MSHQASNVLESAESPWDTLESVVLRAGKVIDTRGRSLFIGDCASLAVNGIAEGSCHPSKETDWLCDSVLSKMRKR
jgi:hypothetical protein